MGALEILAKAFLAVAMLAVGAFLAGVILFAFALAVAHG